MNGMNIEKIHHHRRLTYVNIQCSPQVVGELSDVGFTTRLSGGFHWRLSSNLSQMDGFFSGQGTHKLTAEIRKPWHLMASNPFPMKHPTKTRRLQRLREISRDFYLGLP